MLEISVYGGHVGGHFGKESFTYYSFVTKVMCTKCGAERPASHFGGHVDGHFGKESCILYYSFVTKVMCTKFGAERSTSHFSLGVSLAMAAILGEKLTK